MPNIGRAYLARELFRCLELYKLEMRIMPVLMFVGRKEVCVDNHKLEEKANEMAGKVFILSSPKQVRTALYAELKLKNLKSGTYNGGGKCRRS